MWSSNRRREPERSSEAEGLGSVLDRLAAGRPLRAGMALGVLARRWDEVVGERLARECSPVALDRGLLVIRASSQAWAAQIGFLAEEVRAAVGRVLGDDAVGAVRVVVGTGPTGPKSDPRASG